MDKKKKRLKAYLYRELCEESCANCKDFSAPYDDCEAFCHFRPNQRMEEYIERVANEIIEILK